MNTIHVAGGVGVADTAMASYDGALDAADANLHNYNLVAVSSVVPAEATVEAVEAAPDLGPAGNQLTVVEARRTVGPDDAVDFREGGRAGAEDADSKRAPRRRPGRGRRTRLGHRSGSRPLLRGDRRGTRRRARADRGGTRRRKRPPRLGSCRTARFASRRRPRTPTGSRRQS